MGRSVYTSDYVDVTVCEMWHHERPHGGPLVSVRDPDGLEVRVDDDYTSLAADLSREDVAKLHQALGAWLAEPPKIIEHDPERGCAHGGGACPLFSDRVGGMRCEAMRLEVPGTLTDDPAPSWCPLRASGALVVRPGSGL